MTPEEIDRQQAEQLKDLLRKQQSDGEAMTEMQNGCLLFFLGLLTLSFILGLLFKGLKAIGF